MKLPSIKSLDLNYKKVFLRLDLDVFFEKGKIVDDYRLLATFPTLEYLLKNGSQVIIGGHLGRPRGFDKRLSLEEIAVWFSSKLEKENKKTKLGEFDSWKLGERVWLLENLRFYKGEEENYPNFAKSLSYLADLYVNDAFAASHRKHASIVGIPKLLPHFAGFRLEKEVEELSRVLNEPQRPLVLIIGGEKIETKLPLVEKMHHFADYVLVGGELAEHDHELLKIAHERTGKKSVQIVADLNLQRSDITQKSTEDFKQIIKLGKTIVWNGPIGIIQEKDYQKGTVEIAKAITKTKAHTIVGGGNTVGFLKNEGLLNEFSFVSTGGGAMLAFLAGEKLPGLEALSS